MTKRSFLYYDEMESPVGPLTFFATDKGLCRIDYGSLRDVESKVSSWARKYFLCREFVQDADKFQDVKHQLQEYFADERDDFDLTFDFYGTPFQKRVWNALCEIPYGETRSYKDIALQIQAPRAVRAIGGAVNKNPISIIFPCHRVIGSNGALVGYAGGLDKKKHLLTHEHASVASL